jgi:hypothetical protein
MKTFQQYLETKVPKANYIPENHPVRAVVADIPTYWKSPGEAINRIADILDQHGFTITDVISFNDNLPEYRASYHISEKTDKPFEHGPAVDSQLVFAWHLMDSGRYEITAYLS